MAKATRKSKTKRRSTKGITLVKHFRQEDAAEGLRLARRVEVYPEARKPHTKKQYRWRKVSGNQKIVAVSGEGFDARRYAALAARRECPGVPVVHLAADGGRMDAAAVAADTAGE